MEEWISIPGFSGRYLINNKGEVYSNLHNRIKQPMVNSRGIHYVALRRNGVQYSRSVTLLVAQTFVPQILHTFDTPINLDGDRGNNHYWNIAWRPRWFAIKYFRQFEIPPSIRTPLFEINTGETFNHSMEAVCKYGILDVDIYWSIKNLVSVWPTYQRFSVR